MPWLDIVSSKDWCSLWYISNGPTGVTSSFDDAKPTVLLLHPVFLDTTWLRAQMDDTRLSEGYNLVAMDARCHGRTKSTPSGLHDIWVEVADVAFFCHRLRLPPVHVFAAEGVSTYCALRFAALFPEMVLSLTLCQIPPPEQFLWVRKMHQDLTERWRTATDLVTIEDVGMDFVNGFVGDDTDPDLRDELNAFFQRRWPPVALSRLQEVFNVVLNRTVIEEAVLKAIVQPTVIIQGQWSKMNPIEFAENLVHDLVNVEGGACLYTVRGAKGYINVVPSCATIVNQTFAKFLSSLPHHRSDALLDYQPVEVRMAAALAALSKMTGNPEIARRDPRCPLSFSLMSLDQVESNIAKIQELAYSQANAFSPLGPDGWPVRVYSQRMKEQLSYIERSQGAKAQMPPSALGVIPIGPAMSHPGALRMSDQDLAAKLARGSIDAKTQQRSGTSRPTTGDGSGKLGRRRRGTIVPDSPQSAVKKLAASTAAASMLF